MTDSRKVKKLTDAEKQHLLELLTRLLHESSETAVADTPVYSGPERRQVMSNDMPKRTLPAPAQAGRMTYRPIRRSYRGKEIAANKRDQTKLQPVVLKAWKTVLRYPNKSTDEYIRRSGLEKNTLRYALQILRQMGYVESVPVPTSSPAK